MQYFFWWILFHKTAHSRLPYPVILLVVASSSCGGLLRRPSNRFHSTKGFTRIKIQKKLHQTSKQNQRVFAQNRMCKNVHLNRKPIFFLRSESRRSRLTRVPYWCQRFSYTIKMCSPKTPSRFREVIQQNLFQLLLKNTKIRQLLR